MKNRDQKKFLVRKWHKQRDLSLRQCYLLSEQKYDSYDLLGQI